MHWRHVTPGGKVEIRYRGHQYLVIFEQTLIGVYATAEQVMAAIALGELKAPPRGTPLRELGVPDELQHWERFEPD